MHQHLDLLALGGDDVELRKNLKRQLGPYTELFGEGAVVYWYGFVDGAESPPGISAMTLAGSISSAETTWMPGSSTCSPVSLGSNR